jgi:pyruvate dehydrogenase E1 component beta subunit
MDHETILTSVKKTNRLVVLEEASFCVVLKLHILFKSVCFDFRDAHKESTADTPAPYSPVLLKEWLPNADDVIKAVKKM